MQYTAPGVYVEELSSGIHTIVGVATSIAAFVGYTASGLDGTPVTLNSFADYERSFGGLASDSEVSYAVRQFFLNGGNQAIVVRVPKNGATIGNVTIADVGGTGKALVLDAISTGTWADQLVVTINYDGLPTSAQPGYDQYAFNLEVTNLATGRTESFSGLSMDPGQASFAQAVVNDPDNGSRMIRAGTVEALPSTPALGTTGTPPQPARTGVIAEVPSNWAASIGTGGAVAGFALTIDSDGGTYVPVMAASDPALDTSTITPLLRLLQIRATRALQAKYPGATVSFTQTISNLSKTAPDAVLASVNIANKPDAIATFGAASALSSPPSPLPTVDPANAIGLDKPISSNVAGYWFGGQSGAKAFQLAVKQGGDGSGQPTSVQLVGDEAAFTGIYALEKVDLFNILCIPDATRASAGNPNQLDSTLGSPNDVWAPAMAYCKERRAFLLIDPPPQVNDIPSAIAWKTSGLTVNDINGAAYFPRVRLPDALNNNALRSFAPCGVMAGVYATIDGSRGVWKSPAGIEASLVGVQKLIYTMTQAENGELNQLGLNCLRSFPIYGFVSWGARTLAGADVETSEWKYLAVRRFALFLEESLYRGLQWVVFEPNADPLWASIRLNVTAFLQTLYRQGAFAGTTPASAYFVQCDSSTTTQADIDAGVVNILVGFAPLKPAEFVVLQIQQIAGQLAS